MAKKRSTSASTHADEHGAFERRPPRVERGSAKVIRKPLKKVKLHTQPTPMVQVMTPTGPVDKISAAGLATAERVEQLLQDVFLEALETCQDSLTAFDLDPDAEEGEEIVVPDHWKAELPDEIALKRRLRIAQASLLPGKDAPVALSTARSVVENVVRMQSKQQNVMNVKKLNVAVIVGGTKHEYPSIEVGALTSGGREDD